MNALRTTAQWAAPLALVAACGYPAFQFGPGTSSSGGAGGAGPTASSNASPSASSGAGASSASTTASSGPTASGSGGASSSSGTGGATTCDLFAPGNAGCGAGQRCTIVDEMTGKTGCASMGANQVNAGCLNDSECGLHTWCDHRTETCARFCASANDCGTGNCVPAKNSMLKSIPGTSVCTVDCDPVSTTSCGPGAVCGYDSSIGGTDCYRSTVPAGKGNEGDACSQASDCNPSLVCVGSNCAFWCTPPDGGRHNCPILEGCAMFSNLTVSHGGHDYGFCF